MTFLLGVAVKKKASLIVFLLVMLSVSAYASWGSSQFLGYGIASVNHNDSLPDVYCISWHNCMAVWRGQLNPGDSIGIVYSIWDGVSWSSPSVILPRQNSPYNSFYKPRVSGAENSSHFFYRIVWQAYRQTSYQVYSNEEILTASFDNVSGISDYYNLTNDENDDEHPSVSCFLNPASGASDIRCVVVWDSYGPNGFSSREIKYKDIGKYASSGSFVTNNDTNESMPDIDCPYNPSVSDYCILSYQSLNDYGNWDIHSAVFTFGLTGASWSNYTAVHPANAVDDRRPRVSYFSGNGKLIWYNWSSYQNNYEIATAEWTGNGWTNLNQRTANGQDDLYPDLSCHTTGTLCRAAWSYYSSDYNLLYADWDIGLWNSNNIPTDSYDDMTPSIHCPEDGYCKLVWTSGRISSPDLIFEKTFNTNPAPRLFTANDSNAVRIKKESNVTFWGNWTDQDSDENDFLVTTNKSFYKCNRLQKSGCICYEAGQTDGLGRCLFNTSSQNKSGKVVNVTWYARACDSKNSCTNIVNDSYLIDSKAPIISNIDASELSNVRVKISWDTDESANSTVDYGTTLSLGSRNSSSSFVESHAIWLTGLSPDTLYHFNVTSCDQYENCNESSGGSFRTSPSTGWLNGSVYDAFHNPIPNARVNASNRDYGSYETYTDSEGNFSIIVGVDARAFYNVTASKRAYSQNSSYNLLIRATRGNKTKIRIIYIGTDLGSMGRVSAPGMDIYVLFLVFVAALLYYALKERGK
ncbi:hypothetical protein DRN74_03355 [Candidatus Micrarchaeota archaeon]|nr:MAG: hypothetical protein DRN74_03355 [Candidatus Micrarchaeota archaeon]